ncbi:MULTISPECIES: o-succinylbenzoate--CoA ligase [unclassified Vibrio]|uniref:o-succinylbenzoate--CoA ligase n=1 Tax=unclassified Vibrio TaxID=2614977 RepID=UPI0009ED9FD4|nr:MULTISPECIES: o-succinylbenzoate--CoA ligase [unclassified Vibrio]
MHNNHLSHNRWFDEWQSSHLSLLDYWKAQSSKAQAEYASNRSLSVALEHANHHYTWDDLSQYVASVQQQFTAASLGCNDVLMLVTAHSSFQSLMVYLAALEAGVVVAIVPPLPKQDLTKRQQVLGCSFYYQCPTVNDDLSYLTGGLVLTLDELKSPQLKFPELQLSSSPTKFDQSNLNQAGLNTSNIASLIFTSGSTGEPKAVAHTVNNHLASAIGLQKSFNFDAHSTWLLSLPLFHVSGLAIVWRWLVSGCCLRLKQGSGLNLQGVTHTSMVPTQLFRVLEKNEPITLEKVLLGGGVIPHQLAQLAKEQGVDTWAGYGLTEMASTVTAKAVDHLDSAGKVLLHRDLKLQGQRILVGGETLAVGYWREGKLNPLSLIDDHWFDTKDLGRFSDDELVILGRADNLFISGGENIHCEEIERILISHQEVQQAFIVPIDDPEFGQRPVALLALNDVPLSESLQLQLTNLCRSSLQKFKCPIGYYRIPQSLLNQGIKVSRLKLKQWLSQQS